VVILQGKDYQGLLLKGIGLYNFAL